MSAEQYCLRFETRYLAMLGNAMSYLSSFAVSYAVQATLMETALAGLMTAVAWPAALLSAGSVIDNPWNVCANRAEEAGKLLAQLLVARQHGRRPITLIGFSLGARVIYSCLVEMSKRKNNQGIIEDVILLGAPVSGSPSEWRSLCSVVAGRIINGYSRNDWLLAFLYRTMNAQVRIAGTGPVLTENPKIVNINLTEVVAGHLDYHYKMTEVLRTVGVKVDASVSSTPSHSVSNASIAGGNRSFPSLVAAQGGSISASLAAIAPLVEQEGTGTANFDAKLDPDSESRLRPGEANSGFEDKLEFAVSKPTDFPPADPPTTAVDDLVLSRSDGLKKSVI